MRKQQGITLIALVITIIVMLILVGVTITLVLNGGLIERAKEAANGTNAAIASENDLDFDYNAVISGSSGGQQQEEEQQGEALELTIEGVGGIDSFTINYIEGWKWSDYIESSYNTNHSSCVLTTLGDCVVDQSGNYISIGSSDIHPTDEIDGTATHVIHP